MIILGIDPGTTKTGYGVICVQDGQRRALDYGVIRPPRQLKLMDRYLIIYEGIEELLKTHKPAILVVETQYVQKNVQSALKLGMARGIALIAAKKQNIAIFEYAPTKAKLAVTGTGRASKFQVQGMVQKLLNLSEIPQPEDAADALALALCHSQAMRANSLLGEEI